MKLWFETVVPVTLFRKILSATLLVCAFAGCGGTYEPSDSADLARCYQTEFHALPPTAVKNLQAKQIIVGDSAGQWLRFRTDAAVIRSIVSMGFQPSDGETFHRESGGANIPTWWKPEKDRLISFWSRSGWRKDFSHSIAVLAYDEKQQLVYFHHGAFD